jgi:hypothetical protein
LDVSEIELVAKKVLDSQASIKGSIGHIDVVGCIEAVEGHLQSHPEVTADGVTLPSIELRDDGQWTLHYPAALPIEYFRVTAGIALGIVLLHSAGMALPCRIDMMEQVGSDAHWEAHQFALALLLPEKILKMLGGNRASGPSHSLAFSLGVPYEFLKMRFTGASQGAEEAVLTASNGAGLGAEMRTGRG